MTPTVQAIALELAAEIRKYGHFVARTEMKLLADVRNRHPESDDGAVCVLFAPAWDPVYDSGPVWSFNRVLARLRVELYERLRDAGADLEDPRWSASASLRDRLIFAEPRLIAWNDSTPTDEVLRLLDAVAAS